MEMAAPELVATDFSDRRDEYVAPNCATRGTARSALFAPPGYSLWQVDGELDVGTELEWGTAHGDEAVYVLEGAVVIDGTRVTAGGAVLIEAGVPAVVRAVELSHVAHFGPTEHEPPGDGPFGAPAVEGRGVHIIPTKSDSMSAPRLTTKALEGSYYGDGACPTCRITLYEADGRKLRNFVAPSHVHSADEILYLLDGEMRFGRLLAKKGMALAVPANRRYAFRAKEGFSFLNYRPDAASVTRAPGSEPVLETVQGMIEHHAAAEAAAAAEALAPGTAVP
jgi:quercetin dioxygenase-like cupin family protein